VELAARAHSSMGPERLFVFVYTAYLDESGTHDESPIITMGGMMAEARQWSRFQEDFNKAKRQHGFKVYHTKKVKSRTGEFAGWSNQQMEAFLGTMQSLIAFGLTEGVSINLSKEQYRESYKGDGKPNKAVLDSAYGLCFRTCLCHFLIEIAKRKHKGRFPDLHIVLEAGHPNAGDAERIFLETKGELERNEFDVLRTFVLAKKDECDPLMAADFLAHSAFLIGTGVKQEPPTQTVHRPRINGKKLVGMTHYDSVSGGLENMREHTIEVVNKMVRRTRAEKKRTANSSSA